jgi:hypothetical protein
MRNVVAICRTLVLMLSLPLIAQNSNSAANRDNEGHPVEGNLYEHVNHAMENPKDNPDLPRVLLLGDSISIGYTVPVRQYLQHKANVHRPPVNCQDTAFGLEHLKGWLGSGKWDVIHFNWGIWDTHYLDRKTGGIVDDEGKIAPENMRIRHTLEEYRQNLTKLVDILQGTGAKLIWASSTPIMFRKGDRFDDIANYNEVAARVMKERGIEIEDLYAFVLPRVTKWQIPDQCHFNKRGNKNLGDKVGRRILDALGNL